MAQTSAENLSKPPTLTFDELVTLSREEPLNPELKAKLEQILQTPVVWNNPAAQPPPRLVDGSGEPIFRVAEWNIERGIEFESIEQALTSSDAFEAKAQQAGKLSPVAMTKLRDQVTALRGADVFVLNEVDIGVKRSDYRNVVHDLAESLGMNSAYAVEFLEVDPLVDLGTEAAVLDNPELSAKMTADLKPDRERFRGMHVNAILSRYPIRSAKVIELPVCHDWYNDEQKGISQIEKAKRVAADKVFLERIGREVRRGNRNALLVSLDVPGAPNGVFTVVNVHLENKGKATCRRKQMDRVLSEIRDIPGPVVVAGDLNTTGADGTPTSVRHELAVRVSDYQFWLGQVWKYSPAGIPMLATKPFQYWRSFRDPTATQIPLVGKNPEAPMFADVKKFRFADGGSFDFAGSPQRNKQGMGGTLSDSNERASKGFVPTFSMQRSMGGVFQYRLDWIFVKPEGSGTGPLAFSPEFPTTMKELNQAMPERLSDHAPITVDLPMRVSTAEGK
ncbi:MAG TPA: endonuclease/exonuclease/phosphatase family protein [Acidobacteriaceae bacterium]|nr:endonuclease/exonuclease/phosphatase family protein [Acidobacteriaceae bacterium]